MPLVILMTACFPKGPQHSPHQKHIDYQSTVQIRRNETVSSENKNTKALHPRKNKKSESSDKAAITDLWRAIEKGNRRIINKLIKDPIVKKHINTQNENGETALYQVAEGQQGVSLAGDWLVQQLLDAGANPTFPNGDTILMKYTEQNFPVGSLLEIPAIRNIINAQNEKEETALFLAAKGKEGKIYVGNIQDLLFAGADPSLPDKTGRTVLSIVYEKILLAEKNTARTEFDNNVQRKFYDTTPFVSVLEDLLRAGADLNLPDGDTILMKYSLSGVSVSSLLKIPEVKEVINTHNKNEETAFSLAAKEKHWEVMAELARHDANTSSLCAPHNLSDNISKEEMYVSWNNSVNALKRPKYNILMICSLSGQANGVKKLLENPTVHTNINLRNKNSETAFSLAKEENRWGVMAELARNDADTRSLCEYNLPENIPEKELFVNQNKPYNILMICSLSGRSGVKKLLEKPIVRAYINTQNARGETAFSLAAKETLFPKVFTVGTGGNRRARIKRMLLLSVMQNLLSAGADPNLLPEEHSQEIQQTIATVTYDAVYSDTFLMLLVRRGALDSVEKLLEIPAVKENINARNKNGETAFFLAKKQEHTQVMKLLLNAGADPDIVPAIAGK